MEQRYGSPSHYTQEGIGDMVGTFESGRPPKDIYVCPRCRIAYYSPCECVVGHDAVKTIHYILPKVVHLRSPRVKKVDE